MIVPFLPVGLLVNPSGSVLTQDSWFSRVIFCFITMFTNIYRHNPNIPFQVPRTLASTVGYTSHR